MFFFFSLSLCPSVFNSINKNKTKNISFEENSVPPSHQEVLILVYEVYDPGGDQRRLWKMLQSCQMGDGEFHSRCCASTPSLSLPPPTSPPPAWTLHHPPPPPGFTPKGHCVSFIFNAPNPRSALVYFCVFLGESSKCLKCILISFFVTTKTKISQWLKKKGGGDSAKLK